MVRDAGSLLSTWTWHKTCMTFYHHWALSIYCTAALTFSVCAGGMDASAVTLMHVHTTAVNWVINTECQKPLLNQNVSAINFVSWSNIGGCHQSKVFKFFVGDKKNVYKLFVRKPEGTRPLGRTSEKLHTNIGLICVLKCVQTFPTKTWRKEITWKNKWKTAH